VKATSHQALTGPATTLTGQTVSTSPLRVAEAKAWRAEGSDTAQDVILEAESHSGKRTSQDSNNKVQPRSLQAPQQDSAAMPSFSWLSHVSSLLFSRGSRASTGSAGKSALQADRTVALSASQPQAQEPGVVLVSVQGSSSVTISGVRLLGATSASLVVSNSSDVRVTGVTIHTSSQAYGTYGESGGYTPSL
jgi:hypothetical protein